MPVCRQCDKYFPNHNVIEGKRRNSNNRKFCFECSPFGSKNTRPDISKPKGGSRKEKQLRICKACNKQRYYKGTNAVCPVCRSKIRRNKRKTEAVKLMGGKCCFCGYDKSEKALAFHHVYSNKKFMELSCGWHFPWNVILAELEKCILVCCNCHWEIHDGMHCIEKQIKYLKKFTSNEKNNIDLFEKYNK